MLHDLQKTCSMHRTAEIYNGTRGFFWISVYNTITQSQNQSRSSYKQDLTLCSKTCNIPTNHPYLATTSSHSDRPTEPTDMFPSNPIITQKRVEKEEEMKIITIISDSPITDARPTNLLNAPLNQNGMNEWIGICCVHCDTCRHTAGNFWLQYTE